MINTNAGIHVIKTANGTYRLDRTVPVSEQKWRQHFCLITASGQRFAGICDTVSSHQNIRVHMHAALMYICNVRLEPVMDRHQQPVGLRAMTQVQVLMPYDNLGAVNLEFIDPCLIMRISDQNPEVADWFYENYLQFFSPRQIEVASSPIIKGQ